MRGECGGASQPVEGAVHSLFAFPAESNFCGARYDPGLGSAVQDGGLQVRGEAAPGRAEQEPAALEATGGLPSDAARMPQGAWEEDACGCRLWRGGTQQQVVGASRRSQSLRQQAARSAAAQA